MNLNYNMHIIADIILFHTFILSFKILVQATNIPLCLFSKSNESEPLQRWHFDSSDGTCKQFDYMGRKGNGNRFLTRQSCEESCQPSQDPCELPKTPGPCDNRNERFWFDKEKTECFTFNWGKN